MPPSAAPEPLAPDQATRLADLARALKAAARAASLYPAAHPAIAASSARLLDAAGQATANGLREITVLPDALLVDGRTLARPDVAVSEIALLLHDHLIGELRIDAAATADEWRTFLLLLGCPVEEVRAQGGIARALTTAGAQHLQVREIDYGEVLRERTAGASAAWDRIVAHCLQGERSTLDEPTLRALLTLANDAARFGDLVAELAATAAAQGQGIGVQVAALLRLLRRIVDRLPDDQARRDSLLANVADATARLTPELMLALLGGARSAAAPEDGDVAGTILSRVSDTAVARFVARSVVSEHGATERLAQAFQSLVPDLDRRGTILDAARGEVNDSAVGADPGFPQMWEAATRTLLATYSDNQYVSDAYGRELTGVRSQAVEVERIGDDPPDRIGSWLATVGEAEVHGLDELLLLDLLRIEAAPDRWHDVALTVAAQIEQLTLGGEFRRAEPLVRALAQETAPHGRAEIQPIAVRVIERLATGPMMKHIVLYLRKAEDAAVPPIVQVCTLMGTVVVLPLAEALAAEEVGRSLRRLRELLIGFGPAGRQAVEQLKNSANAAVRRTAVDLLRVFGGREALPELAALLQDFEPQIQREAIRAIIQIGTDAAFAVLQQALTSKTNRAREAILQSVGALRDERAAPLFCYVLRQTDFRGALQPVHLAIIDALGGLAEAGDDAVSVLRDVLHRGQWWAPGRTATFRRAAATSLRRIGTPAATRVLEEAAATGSRAVRALARAQLAGRRPSTREPSA